MHSGIVGKTLLDQYRIDAFLASGGMGTVYRVWDLKRNVPLAMKVLHEDLADDPSIFKRFKREARALEKLAHPNIVTFYGLHQAGDIAFLLERYIDGPTLKQVLRRQKGKPLPVEEALTSLNALSSALGYAHAHGVVHCDVKPGNVMIDQGGSVYLTDFGVARHADSTTTTLGFAGTAAYMAPEQCRGEEVTAQTDVYALGVMLYEMLTGRRPFRGDERETEGKGSTAAEKVRYAHMYLKPPDPREMNPDLSQEAAGVILKALDKEPKDRFNSTRELYEAACDAFRREIDSIQERVSVPDALISTAPLQEKMDIPSVVQPEKPTIGGVRRSALWLAVIPLVLGSIWILTRFTRGNSPISPSVLNADSPLLAETLTSSPPTEMPGVGLTPERIETPSRTRPITYIVKEGDLIFSIAVAFGVELDILINANPELAGAGDIYIGQELIIPPLDVEPQTTTTTAARSNGLIAYTAGKFGAWEIFITDPNSGNTQLLPGQPSNSGVPAWSPSGEHLAFRSNVTGTWQIFVIDLDGTNLQQLTHGNNKNLEPSWSPDGTQIAFVSERDGDKEIYLMDSDGGNLQRLTSNPGWDDDPSWSPDGAWLVFESYRQDQMDIYKIRSDGTDIARLTSVSDFTGTPAWSPDGKFIAFERQNGSEYHIWVMTADGSNAQRLTSHGDENYRPAWSPNGREIAYTSNRDGDYSVYILSLDDLSSHQRLSSGEGFDPAWSHP